MGCADNTRAALMASIRNPGIQLRKVLPVGYKVVQVNSIYLSQSPQVDSLAFVQLSELWCKLVATSNFTSMLSFHMFQVR